MFLAPRLERRLDGIVERRAAVVRETKTRGGTAAAERRAVRQADGRAEIHERFVEQTRVFAGRIARAERLLKGAFARVLCDVDGVCRHARGDAEEVAVNGGAWATVGK